MKKFSILIPSRKRVALLKETLSSIESQTHDKNQIEIVFGIDIDDLDTQKFLNEYQKESDIAIIVKVMERGKGYQDAPNRLKSMISKSSGEYLIHFADDMKIYTKNWDIILIDKIKTLPMDKIYLLYPAHNQMNSNWPLVQIISKRWFDFTSKFTNCIETDTELLIISILLNRRFKIENIKINHAQERDQTFEEGRKTMLVNEINPNSILSIKGFFSSLMDFQVLRDNLNKKTSIAKKSGFKLLKFYVLNFVNLFYYIYVIKKELKINYIKYFLKNVYQKNL